MRERFEETVNMNLLCVVFVLVIISVVSSKNAIDGDELVVLIGGRNLNGWRRDAEVWGREGKVDVDVPDFPYTIDAPYGWWTSDGLLVCGGRNWDIDAPEQRCWRLDICDKKWTELVGNNFMAPVLNFSSSLAGLEMPVGLLGGVSINVGTENVEQLWVIGGGNGSALPFTLVRTFKYYLWILFY